MIQMQTNFQITLNQEGMNKFIQDKLTVFGFKVAELAKERVPKDTGALERSINPRVDGLTCTIAAETDYALEQETNESYEHPRKGQAHYMLSSFQENTAALIDSLGQEIKK